MATHLSKINDMHLMITVFTTLHHFSVVQEVLEFAAINLEK
jgi:hypothetical protein